jgi:hypothetical protein
VISAGTRSSFFIDLPQWFSALQGMPNATLGKSLPLIARSECTAKTWNAPNSRRPPLRCPSDESCFAVLYASIRDARRLPPCLRSVPMRLSMRR